MPPLPKLLLVFAIFLGSAESAAANPQAWEPLERIRAAALGALQAGEDARAVIAPGLRVAACRQVLMATPRGAYTAEVRCPDTPGWRLYVPVRVARPTGGTVRPGGPRPLHAASVPETAADRQPPAVTVKRGDPVVLRAIIGGIEIRMGGRALGPATAGATVNVENVSSHRVVRGRLSPDGIVEVVN